MTHNQTFANLLSRLSNVMTTIGEPMRAKAYKKAEETILGMTHEIHSVSDIENQPNIGRTIQQKLREYLETGKIKVLEINENKPEVLFTNIYGIGPKKASEIVQKGITTLPDLIANQDKVLNAVQKKGLEYYDDIMERIPRSEIVLYDKLFGSSLKELKFKDPSAQYEIVGSYRRGQESSGDIDVIVSSSTPNTFTNLLDVLIEKEIIVEVLSRGKNKCLVIAKIPSSKTYRRVDFLYASPEEFAFSILYFTGSKGFNIVMRGHALKIGYSMNEHGFTPKVADRQFREERDIFDFLGLEYKKPQDRVDGRAVKEVMREQTQEKPSKKKEETESFDSQRILSDNLLIPIQIPKVKLKSHNKTQKKDAMTKIQEIKENVQKEIKEADQVKTKIDEIKEKVQKEKPKKEKESKGSESFDSQRILLENLRIPISIPISKSQKKSREPTETKKNKTRKSKKSHEEKMDEEKMDESKKGHEDKSHEENHIKPKLHKIKQMENILRFKEQGISVLDKLSEKVLNEIIEETNDAYYNENPLLTDNEYDIIKEYIEKKYPKSEAICKVGAPIRGTKVTLPFEMASMDKIKPDSGALDTWMAKYKGPYVLSCKLDGVSGLYVCNEENQYKLYTRGNGCIGQDISHLIPFLDLPKIPKGMAVRGEFILSKTTFATKYSTEFANARNLVSGIIHRKSTDEKAGDIHFITYEMIEPKLKPADQLKRLKAEGFRVVQNKDTPTLTNVYLSDLLLDWRKTYDYDIDGIIVTNDAIYPRQSGNPDFAFAFKMVLSDQLAEAKVVDVLWEASKDGYLKPRVRIDPIQLGGVKIEYATGFNGKFIQDNKIGIGAVITMVRSGDVIPFIKSVTTPAETAKMPLVPFVWNKTHVDVLLEKPNEDEGVQEKNITLFFTTIGVDGLAKGNIHKLFISGKTTVAQILRMTAADFETVDGFQKKTAKKLAEGIQEKIGQATLLDILVASGKMGRGLGVRKLKLILSAFPDILMSPQEPIRKEDLLKSVAGIGPENAREFVKNTADFLDFLRECGLESKLESGGDAPLDITETGPFTGKKIVMTKVRDKDIIAFVTSQGGLFEDTMKKDIFALIVKSKEDKSNKTEYAEKNNIPIMTVEEFKKTYMG